MARSSPRAARCALLFPVATLLSASAPALAANEVLLIPNSGSDKVWAVSPADGSVISTSFIPNTEGQLSQPIQAIPSGTGTILVTDETRKAVYEFAPNGRLFRTLAGPAGAVAGAYGICVRDGFAYFTSGSGVSTSSGFIYKVSLKGGPVTVFSDWTTIGAPRGIQPYGDGFLVGNSTNDNLEIVDQNGVVAPVPFNAGDGTGGVNFPQQLKRLPKGQFIDSAWMVTGFSAPSGIHLYSASGIANGFYSTVSPRGCHVLSTGDILFTGGTRISKIDVASSSVVILQDLSGASFRFIDSYTPPCTGDLNNSGAVDASDLAIVLAAWGSTNAIADVNGSGTVDATDLAAVLAAWGPC